MSVEGLSEAAKILDDKKIDYWVTGGYAVDIAVGKLTREHKNIDLLIKTVDSGRVSTALDKKDYIISYGKDRLVAKKGDTTINLTPIDESNGSYVIPTLNVYAEVPKSMMKPVIQELEGRRYPRISNELLYLLTRYSPNQSDAMIVKNLEVNKKALKKVKVVVRSRW